MTANIRRLPRNRTPLTADARTRIGIAVAESRGVLLYSDKTLTCADCGQQFVFTASEQDFYAQRGFTEPRRCPTDRAARKAARQSSGAGYSSGYGDSGSYGGGGGYGSGGGYSSGGGGGGYDRGPREMFAATCSNCGNEARVPFRPTSGKPVYCSDCFRTMRG
ncbi:MAG TPA: CxxC-x17-CxxC domain-containing protein [Candidatus Limnocylindrales bacterium]|nr:CxxC-x17-CxxC domain-containing protein [Candidatus Limnocylindrales bacterium]